jgi:hypothetical protein
MTGPLFLAVRDTLFYVASVRCLEPIKYPGSTDGHNKEDKDLMHSLFKRFKVHYEKPAMMALSDKYVSEACKS